MGRRRRGRSVSGILVLDKSSGLSSNAALQRVKRLFNAAKAGHTGSLDPLATGVLPLCFGEATKFSSYLLNADKGYRTTVARGQVTDTGDSEGEIVARCDASDLTLEQIEQALEAFRGEIEQQPPMYSALKRNGQPLYRLARQGIEVERESRSIRIDELRVESFQRGAVAELDLHVSCSKGTYIRSLAMDLGAALGVGGHVTRLRRTRAGSFVLKDAISYDALEVLANDFSAGSLDACLLPVDSALDHIPRVTLPEASAFYLRQGQPVLVPKAPCDGMVRVASEAGEFLGLGEVLDDGRIAPRRLVASAG